MKRYEVKISGKTNDGLVEVFDLTLDAEGEKEARDRVLFMTDGGTIIDINEL